MVYMTVLLSRNAVTIPTLYANVKENDEFWKRQAKILNDKYWQGREEVAEVENQEAYVTGPYKFTENVTDSVSDMITGEMNVGRKLAGKLAHDSCVATNPIDRCWRCDSKWEKKRKKLANCVIGFGRNAIGGKNGRIYKVTSNLDKELINPVPGIRHAVTRNVPLWIIFSRSMTIKLSQELIVNSDKTIDGMGLVLLSNSSRMTRSDGDGISIFGSSHVWIDHVSMRNCSDGLIDAIQGSTAITISNSHFTDHNEVMLFGASDSYTADKHPTIVSEGNRFIAPYDNNAKRVTKRDYAPEKEWKKWQWRSIRDELMNGAIFLESWSRLTNRPFERKDMISSKPGTYVGRLTRYDIPFHLLEVITKFFLSMFL
ncbi:unnamed protein product [Sphenostylis stenocarpa]|uniref:Pectate lyase n=1 Tax=Sphenostylis stenocarpa TaxID=92480 RepID=A0AA86SJQ5_9FABA|nr:unnamed protein product [Sphenostylis stenocarpa]